MYTVHITSKNNMKPKQFTKFAEAKDYVKELNQSAYIMMGPVVISQYDPNRGFYNEYS